jgi:hypothetical protein
MVNPAAQLPLNPAAAAHGQPGGILNTQASSTGDGDRGQVWRPSIRFMGSPSCRTAQHAAAAAGSITAAAAAAGSDSASVGGVGQTAACTAGSGSSEEYNAVHNAASGNPVGSSSNNNNNSTAKCSSSSGCGGPQQVERRLLSSSWSIRKKNLAPASYRAAQQAEFAAAQQTLQNAYALQPVAPAEHTAMPFAQHSAAQAAADGQPTGQGFDGGAGMHISSSNSNRGVSGWEVQCRGQLTVSMDALAGAYAGAYAGASGGASDGQGGCVRGAAGQVSSSGSTVQGESLCEWWLCWFTAQLVIGVAPQWCRHLGNHRISSLARGQLEVASAGSICSKGTTSKPAALEQVSSARYC